MALAVVAGLFFGAAAPAGALSLAKPGLVSVGYKAGSGSQVASLIKTLGGTIQATSSALGVDVVYTLDTASLITSLLKSSLIRYAQLDENVASASTSATATRWNTASWDATRWNWNGTLTTSAMRWNGDGWNTASWGGNTTLSASATRWNGAGWDTASWDGTASDGSATGYTAMDPGYPNQWGLGAINAPDAWKTTVGTMNRVICVVDTGVDYTHPDLAAHMWSASDGTHGWNYVATPPNANPMDDAGHGTHVAGIAAAVSGNGLGIAGVAQEKIMAVKVLNATGSGKESDAAFGLQWCADHGANIASLSLSTPKDKGVLRDGVSYALSHGMLVVASVGNDGCACARYPAAYSGVIAVASYGIDGTHSGFSNTGSYVTLSAPGENILSLYKSGLYAVGSGTSMAAPFVAGAAALAWGANPALSASRIASILNSTAWDLGASGRDATYGYGGVNAHAALVAALAAK
ncbi:MAG: S8 family serine peptidase [Thermoplasmatota archaeon]